MKLKFHIWNYLSTCEILISYMKIFISYMKIFISYMKFQFHIWTLMWNFCKGEIVHVIAKNFNPVNRAEFNPGVENAPCNRPLSRGKCRKDFLSFPSLNLCLPYGTYMGYIWTEFLCQKDVPSLTGSNYEDVRLSFLNHCMWTISWTGVLHYFLYDNAARNTGAGCIKT
jgi:hypothetical protein